MSHSIAVVLGTRPEIIKFTPIIQECEKRGYDWSVIHTGQHYSDSLDSVFFRQLGLDDPEYNLDVGSASSGQQIGTMIGKLDTIFDEQEYDTVLVQGDTNSALAGSIAASKQNVPLGHVEAGLRSFDRNMPEEINRILSDHAADYLFAPTDESGQLLIDEGIPDSRIHVTGNTIVDALRQNTQLADEESSVLEDFGLESGQYTVLTAHREENVDNIERFRNILDGVSQFSVEQDLDSIYPVHPRAKKQIRSFDLDIPDRIRLVDSLAYLDFLKLQNHAALVFTDSGGVQEETCILQTPCVTVRDNTERPETLEVGSNCLTGTRPVEIAGGATKMIRQPTDWDCPFGDGRAAERILNVIAKSSEMTAQ